MCFCYAPGNAQETRRNRKEGRNRLRAVLLVLTVDAELASLAAHLCLASMGHNVTDKAPDVVLDFLRETRDAPFFCGGFLFAFFPKLRRQTLLPAGVKPRFVFNRPELNRRMVWLGGQSDHHYGYHLSCSSLIFLSRFSIRCLFSCVIVATALCNTIVAI